MLQVLGIAALASAIAAYVLIVSRKKDSIERNVVFWMEATGDRLRDPFLRFIF